MNSIVSKNNCSRTRLTGRSAGFTLVETLIALVILSIGLLGIASLQMASLKNNNSAYLRTQATTLAYSVLDRMRANRDAAVNGDYNTGFGVYTSSNNCDGSSANCTSSQMADFDLGQWKAQLIQDLPKGDGKITTTTLAGSATQVTVTVEWDDTHGQGPLTQLSVSTAL